jgi:regulatory protein
MDPQTRRPDRYNVWLDGRFAFAIDGALALAEGLAVGGALTDDDLARLTEQEEERSLYDAALRFLAARPRSRAEVKRRLLRPQAGKPQSGDATARAERAEQVERTLDRLAEADLLDDDAFAAYWAEQRERFSPRSARAITQELRQHGVDGATAAQATDASHDAEQAMRAARQRLHAMRTDDYATFRTRLGGFLQRRGFGYGVTAQVVRDLWAEAHHDAAPDGFDATDDQGEFSDG